MNVLADRFSALDDPRESGKVIYPLTDIVVIAVCAAIAGAESYEDIVLYGKSKTSWLSEFLDLDKGISTKGSRQRDLDKGISTKAFRPTIRSAEFSV